MCWCACISDCCLIIISVLFPPLPVWIRRGFCTCDSLINVLLCLLGYLPGLIHSWYIIAKYPPYSQYRNGNTKVYYVYRNDLEAQTPRSRNDCHHHHHNETTRIIHETARQEPSAVAPPALTNYGVVQEGTSSTPNAPPAYAELDNKQQK